jgi:hypothetical protein
VIIDTVLHASISDLEFTLSHNGIVDTLLFRNGGPDADFIEMVLSDASTMPIDSGIAPYSGRFMPYRALSAFAGLDPSGPWVLSIYDGVENNSGTLNAWSLRFYYEDATLTSSLIQSEIRQVDEGVVLHQNYPNPFYGQTTIGYTLDESCEVEIHIFDFVGKKVATIYKAIQASGEYNLTWDASNFQSGIYILQLKTGSRCQHRKMILMR